jgi:hypothetical protein
LFWKTKKATENLFFHETKEKRGSFRVIPPAGRPIKISFKGKPTTVKNIGAFGLSFPNNELVVGDTDLLAISLPDENAPISVQTEVVDIDEKGICHCQFRNTPDAHLDAIHRYMLAVQLEEVRQENTNGKAETGEQGKP